MKYELGILEEALKEWGKLDSNTREQFKSKLTERLANPRVPASKLSGHKDRFMIKLSSVGYRLVYEVRESELIVIVVAVGKRERNAVYAAEALDAPTAMKQTSTTETSAISDDAPTLRQAHFDRAKFRVGAKAATRRERHEAVRVRVGKR